MSSEKDVESKLSNPKFESSLKAIEKYGIISHRIVRDSDGLAEHQANYIVKKLKLLRIIAPIASETVYAERTGRPETPYILTPRGENILAKLGYAARRLELDGPKDVSHRLCTAMVASQALSAEIEKVVPNTRIRADVFSKLRNGTSCLVEIEQMLDHNHKGRATEKLRIYNDFFETHPNNFFPHLLLVFNLPEPQLEKTVRIWQLALRDVGELNYQVYYVSLSSFIAYPSFGDWDNGTYQILTPAEKKSRAEPEAASLVPNDEDDEDLAARLADRAELIFETEPIVEDAYADLRIPYLCRFASTFYDIDFNEHTGQTSLYSARPVNSIGRLMSLLHEPEYRNTLLMLKTVVANFRKQTSITAQMNAATDLVWTFLGAAFRLYQGGPLRVAVTAPMVGDNAEGIHFKVWIDFKTSSFAEKSKQEKYVDAVRWLLESFIKYPRELGLVESKDGTKKTKFII